MNEQDNELQADDIIPGGPCGGSTVLEFCKKHQVAFWRSIRQGCRYSDTVMREARRIRDLDSQVIADDIAIIRAVRGSHFPPNSQAADTLEIACQQKIEWDDEAGVYMF